MLPSARRRQQETSAREAAGESLWTDQFETRALVRISQVWGLLEKHLNVYDNDFTELVGNVLRSQGGWSVSGRLYSDSLAHLTDSEYILDVIAAVHEAALRLKPDSDWASSFADYTNKVMREHRIAYKFVEGELVPFTSDELLQEVVEPTLRLLVGDKFKAAHASYLDALKEISHGKPDDAITDAGRALQQTLTALGCEGDVLSQLIKDGKNKGLFRSHDQQLEEAVVLVTKWAASERNKLGDTHDDSGPVIADAWLMVHVVGALIVRLADPNGRGSTA